MDDDRTAALLRSVQEAALDSNRPVSDALRLCVAAGGRLGSTALQRWARQELRGYAVDDDLPGYRNLHAQLQMDYINGLTQWTGQTVTPGMLPEEARDHMYRVPMRAAIAEVEAMARRDDDVVKMTAAAAEALAATIAERQDDNEFLSIHAVYWSVPISALAGIVDQVRTRLVELVSEFDLALAAPNTAAPEAAAHAIHVVIGERSTVSLAAATGDRSTATAAPSSDSRPKWWERSWWTVSRAIGAAVVGLATIVGTWATLSTLGIL